MSYGVYKGAPEFLAEQRVDSHNQTADRAPKWLNHPINRDTVVDQLLPLLTQAEGLSRMADLPEVTGHVFAALEAIERIMMDQP